MVSHHHNPSNSFKIHVLPIANNFSRDLLLYWGLFRLKITRLSHSTPYNKGCNKCRELEQIVILAKVSKLPTSSVLWTPLMNQCEDL